MILKDIEREKSITISALEKKIGVSNGTLVKIIQRNSKISSDILAKILQLYPDLSPSWLITGSGSMYSKEYKIDDHVLMVNEELEIYGKRQCSGCIEKDSTIRNLNEMIGIYRRKLEECEKNNQTLTQTLQKNQNGKS